MLSGKEMRPRVCSASRYARMATVRGVQDGMAR